MNGVRPRGQACFRSASRVGSGRPCGRWAVFGRNRRAIAGLERAVDPNCGRRGAGCARVALVGVAEPFAAFEDSPSARAVAGALRLDMLVVAPAGNDGSAGPGYGSISGPGGSRAALTVGAADLRDPPPRFTSAPAGPWGVLRCEAPLAGAVAPERRLSLRVVAPRLSEEDLERGTPPRLSEFFDEQGFSLVAGQAALVPEDPPRVRVVPGGEGGREGVVLFGDTLPGGGIGLEETTTLPVVSVPEAVGRRLLAELDAGRQPLAALSTANDERQDGAGRVAPFSSHGLAFDGFVKPDLVAPGVGLLTSDPGKAEDGTPRYATVSGSSASAAVVAGAAALLAQARPDLDASALKGLLAGSARALPASQSPRRAPACSTSAPRARTRQPRCRRRSASAVQAGRRAGTSRGGSSCATSRPGDFASRSPPTTRSRRGAWPGVRLRPPGSASRPAA